ncbi:hypothetical protein, partial [Mycolicibacterium alvei]|uniref:Uncharacterized protein n=1 Tax=Mycolicibacterium alvei TaxID=67081 RepID=A0A6N4UPB3_9MYCO|nr:hypothetical protein MALV_08280 [Mycolicibacterium alvei]
MPGLFSVFVVERDLARPSGAEMSVLGANINGHGEAAEARTTTPAHREADKTTGQQYSHAFTHAGRSTHSDGAARHE